MQIRPNFPLAIVYVISDPSDAGTYYVRSVLRNSATGAIIQINGANFVNLTVSPTNSRRFSKTIQAPQDSSGNGFYIDVTTTVYTNSGYTTVSSGYQEENVKYFVLEPWTVALGSGGGRGGFVEDKSGQAPGVDYNKIKELILEVFNNLPTSDLPALDLTPIIIHLLDLKSSIRNIEPPEVKKNDLEGHTSKLLEAINGIEFPEQKETDLSPVIEAVKSIEFPQTLHPDEHREHVQKIYDEISKLKSLHPLSKYETVLGELATHIEDSKKNNLELRVKNLK